MMKNIFKKFTKRHYGRKYCTTKAANVFNPNEINADEWNVFESEKMNYLENKMSKKDIQRLLSSKQAYNEFENILYNNAILLAEQKDSKITPDMIQVKCVANIALYYVVICVCVIY